MAGYNNYSMSNNAVDAYERGERPRSKWTKAEILSFCGDKAEILSALTVEELRNELLENCGWHHTSNHYNRTDFFSIDAERLEALTEADVAAIVSARKPRAAQQASPVYVITAEITYTVWEGRFRNYRRPVDYTEIVTYKSTDKLVETEHGGVKRLSSLKSIKQLSEEEVPKAKPSVKDRLKEPVSVKANSQKRSSPKKEECL